MTFLAPRIAQGIGTAMARVAERFFFFSILLVGATAYLPHPVRAGLAWLLVLAALAVGMIIFLHLFPWDRYEPRVFTLSYLFSSSLLMSILVYQTGGLQSSYGLLYFLIVLFSYFYNLKEMFAITTVVTLFYLFPYLYSKPQSQHVASSAVTVLFFYLGTYILYGVTRFVLKRNAVLTDLNTELSELYDITAGLTREMETEAVLNSLSERLKDHLPSTYAVVMLFDDKQNLMMRIACPVRTIAWEPAIGSVYARDRLPLLRKALETRQPRVYRLDKDEIDEDLKPILTPRTQSLLVVPIRVSAENVGVVLFGEERKWDRTPFNHEKIQLAVAIGRQVAVAVNLWWCYERIVQAQHDLKVSHDKVVKAERLAAIGEVARAVEHEINNPLSVIVNWSEIYREDATLAPEMRKKFQIVYDMSMRIGEVVKRLTEVKNARSVEFMKGQKMTDIQTPE